LEANLCVRLGVSAARNMSLIKEILDIMVSLKKCRPVFLKIATLFRCGSLLL
jgi:hypothetical protein